ncbi:hypothetical protein EYF88_15230 [Paracoccus sediminis]|uniref:Uncharacterized protein n=1 Tax=Paracoccus sediminis TaxID=1214787 RepID=A0A238XVR7_9RHOB|nr:hypothetical protein [Paracoccus sediminis]TBN47554.1 hypothetical protein EYF88_15230 [Paracoccus sediminis]SNR63136.1 hypothetical protein SAMN06265378_1138 [Paracoccus sediminis]
MQIAPGWKSERGLSAQRTFRLAASLTVCYSLSMKHSAFTHIVAKSCRIPEKTVAIFVRNLKEAGLVTSGARGVNAPEMTVMDLTRTLIALCATDRPSDAVSALNRYRAATCGFAAKAELDGKQIEIGEIGETFEDHLCNLLSAHFNVLRKSGGSIEVFQNIPAAIIRVFGGTVYFQSTLTDDEQNNSWIEDRNGSPYPVVRGIAAVRSISASDLREMAILFFLEREDGTTWEDMVASGNAAEIAARHVFGVGQEDKS